MNLSITRSVLCRMFVGIALSLSFSTVAFAHHGGAQEWDRNTSVGPISGTATKFAFTFPHILIYLDVTDENGQAQNYVMNSRWTPTILRKHGWTRNSIKPGDTLTVTYAPHRTRENVGALIRLEVNGAELPVNFEN